MAESSAKVAPFFSVCEVKFLYRSLSLYIIGLWRIYLAPKCFEIFLLIKIPHHKTTSRVTKTHYTNKTLKAIVRNETEIKIELEAMGGSE